MLNNTCIRWNYVDGDDNDGAYGLYGCEDAKRPMRLANKIISTMIIKISIREK